MPSALETLVKILKLERNQGYRNNAVIGGLGAYGRKWRTEAHEQARIPEHHMLVDELTDLLDDYEQIDGKNQRHQAIRYMMDRITGRKKVPDAYRRRYEDAQTQDESVTAADDEPEDTSEQEVPPEPVVEAVAEPAADVQAEAEQQPPPLKPEERLQPVYATIEAPDPHESAEARSERHERLTELFVNDPPPTSGPDLPPEPRLARPPRVPQPKIDPDEAEDIMRGLSASVTRVRGVGPKMADSLRRLGITTINDLLFTLPRRYDDYTQLAYISKLKPNMVTTVVGTVRFTQVREGRNKRKDFYMELDDGSGVLGIIFFGQHFLNRSIRRGKQIVVSGKITLFAGRLQMSNPEWEELDAENLHTVGIVPVYPLTEGLSARAMRRLMKDTVDYWAERLPDYVPTSVLDRTELADLGWTIRNLHFPEGMDHLGHAQRRFIFDQLLLMQMAVLANRRQWQAVPAVSLPVDDDFLEPFIAEVFPYELTGAQNRAIADIRRDIARDVPMNRLLQGDVGSGKTAVATTALAMTIANGKQAALMAPTSILAEQHYRGITAAFERMPGDNQPNIALLTGSLSAAQRQQVYDGLADGSVDIVIGTHALIQSGVEFNALALAVIDEQHRFGVEQRGTLRGKGTNPHLLVMTATPIPRTLALTLYADLDLSVMDEMPPGRIPIKTRIVHPVERERIYGFINNQIEQGRQAFIVYPLVEASEKIEAQSATEAYERLSKVFYEHRVGLLHGRMKPQEKDDIMAAFAEHEFDVLVTTSVAEVGVDIPNASVIVIEGANRFGLAQLHQFRGRVGRGKFASYCLLLPDNSTEEAMERLEAMEQTGDGFKLAEIDWKLRGPGDLVGTRQSGQAAMQLAEMMTPELVSLAQQEARTLYEEDPDLTAPEHRLLAQRVQQLYHPESDVS